MAYIGTGKDSENDKTLTIQANEAVEINSGKIYYTSQDHTGTFRVGKQFFVDFETGQTSFDAGDLTFTGVSSITVGDETAFTYIDGNRVDIGNIRISGNTITTIDGQLNLTPVTEILNLDNNPGLVLPNNTDLNRPEQTADLRYNTGTNLFEGYANTGNIAFGGVFSDDRETFIRPNQTTGAITFGFGGVQVGQVNDYGLELHGLSDEDILINDNLITTTLSNSDLELRRDSGVVRIDNIQIYKNTITNLTSDDTNLSFVGTDDGYIKFDATTGIVIPFGTTAERTPSPEIGDTRWNTDLEILETWNGTSWQRAAGEGEEVTDAVLKELVDIYTLVLG